MKPIDALILATVIAVVALAYHPAAPPTRVGSSLDEATNAPATTNPPVLITVTDIPSGYTKSKPGDPTPVPTDDELVQAGTGWYASAVLDFHKRCDALGTNDTVEVEKDVWKVVCEKWLEIKLKWDALSSAERIALLSQARTQAPPTPSAFLSTITTSPPAALPIETPLTGPTNAPEFHIGQYATTLMSTNTPNTDAVFMLLTESHYPVFEIRVASTNYGSWTNFDTYPKSFTFSRTNADVLTLTMLEGGVLTNLVFHERPAVRCDGTNWLVDLDPAAKPVREDPNATNAIATSAFASGFSQGIRYSLLAATRNPDVHDARILAMIAAELLKRGNP